MQTHQINDVCGYSIKRMKIIYRVKGLILKLVYRGWLYVFGVPIFVE